MAPNLSVSQHDQIQHMIQDGAFTIPQISDAANCSFDAVKAISRNLRNFGSTRAPRNPGGRPSSITPIMRDALLEHLLRKPDLYLEELVVYLWDEFEARVSKSAISRTLRSANWSKKKARGIAKGRNADLRDFYLHSISSLRSSQIVYIDESGCDKRIGFRRTGWSPLGVTPVQITQFHRGQRYQILPAYTQNGILLSRVFQGTTDSAMFEDFIEQLLHHCTSDSVLIMDNASFHRSDRIKEMCSAAGVKLLYLPPYSPDLNPIEEFFAELKAFIKKHWKVYEENPGQDFTVFLEWCVDMVGGKEKSAKGHFRNAGWNIEELEKDI
jgi:transposase